MSEEEMSAACGVMLLDAPFFHDERWAVLKEPRGVN